MVSILNQVDPFTFPRKMKLKHKAKWILEGNVDKKYYLSQKMLEGMLKTDFNSYKLENRLQDTGGVLDTLTTATGNRCPHLLKTSGGGLPILEKTKKGFKIATYGDGIDISSRMKHHRGTVQKDLLQTLTTQCDVGVIVNEKNKENR